MKTLSRPEQVREASRAARVAGKAVGLVPTMGYLHEGHGSLLRKARSECGYVIASIFVNPTQFGPGEDLDHYPRDLARDLKVLESHEVDLLFHPEPDDIYPQASPHKTWVTVEQMSGVLCGASRPDHFRGVTTIVLKLINITEPDVAVFGQKDAQQAIIIRKMAQDLNLATRIEISPTIREEDGLALSSRNAYLSETERAVAPAIYRALQSARNALRAGERSPARLLATARAVLAREPLLQLEYAELVNMETLEPLSGEEPCTGGFSALLAVAGRIGKTRLIDNVILAVKE